MKDSGPWLQSFTGITAAGTVQELPKNIDSPVSLLIQNNRNLFVSKGK
jgi:hypothetical protein